MSMDYICKQEETDVLRAMDTAFLPLCKLEFVKRSAVGLVESVWTAGIRSHRSCSFHSIVHEGLR